jgi:hypothetical protein
MSADGAYLPGDHVLERGVHDRKVRFVLPLTVVRHDGEVVVTWLRPGTRYLRPLRDDGTHDRNATDRWTLGEQTWTGTNVLMVTRWGRAHSLWHFFDDAWSFRGWYANLQAPYGRDRFGFTTDDHALDVWIPAETGEPEWKDEDEFAEAVAAGAYDEASVRAEGGRVMRERAWPTGWEGWRPPPEWTETPQLVPGCERR